MEIKLSTVLVTGASSGIGEATAKYFAKLGAKVAVVDLGKKDVDRVLKDIKYAGGEAIGVQADVTSESDTAKFIKTTLEAFGTLNIVVSCAGIIHDGTMLSLDKKNGKASRKMGRDKWQSVNDVNLTGDLSDHAGRRQSDGQWRMAGTLGSPIFREQSWPDRATELLFNESCRRVNAKSSSLRVFDARHHKHSMRWCCPGLHRHPHVDRHEPGNAQDSP